MLLKGFLLISISTLVAVLALFWYYPLPDGVEDPWKCHILMKICTFVRAMGSIGKYLGFGSLYSNIWRLQTFEIDREPVTASYGDLKVTRDVVAGVPVIIYQPKDSSKLHPAIVYFHGGGWTLGGLETYDKTVYDYANQTGAVVFSVGYRLAPHHPFPVPLQDSFDVTSYVLKHGDKYNVDVTRVGVAGDSAGGNLASAVVLKLSQEKADLPPLLYLVLHCPALQALDLHLPSHIDYNWTMPILTLDVMVAFYAYYMGLDVDNMENYVKVISENRHIPPYIRNSKYAEYLDVKLLPEEFQTPKKGFPAAPSSYDEKVYDKIKDVVTNPLFSPLLAPNLTGMPPTLVHVSEFDVLRDDGLLFARRLQDAGVKVQVYFAKGGYHADINKLSLDFLQSSSGKKALSAAYAFINGIIKQ